MTEDLNSILSKLILVARTKNGGELVFLESHVLERERRLRPPPDKASCIPFHNILGTAWNVLLGVCPDLPFDCVTDTHYSYKETHVLTRHRHIARN